MVEPVFQMSAGQTADAEYAKKLAAHVGGWDGRKNEGVVIAFEDSGHRVKIKCREYVALHRARDEYSTESQVLQVWSDGNQDELFKNLSNERASRLAGYYLDLEARIGKTVRTVTADAGRIWYAAEGDRKRAAEEWIAQTGKDDRRRPLGFNVFDALARKMEPQGAVEKNIRRQIAQACSRQSLIESKVLPMLGNDPPRWRPPDGNKREQAE